MVRNADLKDLHAMHALFTQYRAFYQMEVAPTEEELFLKERLEKKDSVIYVFENELKQLKGFVQLYPLFSSTQMKKYWLLNDLFVQPEERGKRISLALIDKAKELVRASDACGMFLETEKKNLIGNQLYPRVGFKLQDKVNFYTWTP